MRKIYLLPNLVTSANLFCGFYSMIAATEGKLIRAAWFIIGATFFDMLDGRVARMARATSQFGVEYDSLSDLTSFGMAPGLLLYLWGLQPFGRLGWTVAFLYVMCGALRLARFNVSTAKVPKNYFQGLPIPIAAGMVATFLIFKGAIERSYPEAAFWLPTPIWAFIFALGLGALMVSTLKFPSFKELNWRSRASFGFLMIGLLSMICIVMSPEITLFALVAVFVGVGLLVNLYWLLTGRGPKQTESAGGGTHLE